MDLVDKWPCLRLTGIREQDYGIDPQSGLSQDLCVQNKGVGGAKLTGRTRGCVSGRPWPLLRGLGADNAHVTHGPGRGHSGKTRGKTWSRTREPVPQALGSQGMSGERTFPCAPPAPVWQPRSLSITDGALASSREGGGLTEPPGAAASAAPCRPAQRALSPLPRSAVGPARGPEAGTRCRGSEASPASATSCRAEDRMRGEAWAREAARQQSPGGPTAACPSARPPPLLTGPLLTRVLGLAVSSGGCRATSPNFTVSGGAEERDRSAVCPSTNPGETQVPAPPAATPRDDTVASEKATLEQLLLQPVRCLLLLPLPGFIQPAPLEPGEKASSAQIPAYFATPGRQWGPGSCRQVPTPATIPRPATREGSEPHCPPEAPRQQC